MLKPFFEKCIRVWHLLRKPTAQEFKSISKISAFGIGVIGLLGFLVALIVNIFT